LGDSCCHGMLGGKGRVRRIHEPPPLAPHLVIRTHVFVTSGLQEPAEPRSLDDHVPADNNTKLWRTGTRGGCGCARKPCSHLMTRRFTCIRERATTPAGRGTRPSRILSRAVSEKRSIRPGYTAFGFVHAVLYCCTIQLYCTGRASCCSCRWPPYARWRARGFSKHSLAYHIINTPDNAIKTR
jgi:hypothetical protein